MGPSRSAKKQIVNVRGTYVPGVANTFEDPEEGDLDPGHTPNCLVLITCMALHDKPQRASSKPGPLP